MEQATTSASSPEPRGGGTVSRHTRLPQDMIPTSFAIFPAAFQRKNWSKEKMKDSKHFSQRSLQQPQKPVQDLQPDKL